MSYEVVGGNTGEWAPTKYVRYTMPEDGVITEKMHHMKPNDQLEGWFLKSYEREFKGKVRKGHIVVQKDGTHYVIPDNKEVTEAFMGENIVKGAKTRFTYLGKKQFTTKTGETARAVKALVEQDKSDVVEFEGAPGCESIKGSQPMQAAKQATSAITSADVPF